MNEKKIISTYDTGCDLMDRGDYKRANNLVAKSLQGAIKLWGNKSLDAINIRATLGLIQMQLGLSNQAKAHLTMVLRQLKGKPNQEDIIAIKLGTMRNLAKVLFDSTEVAKAYGLYRKSFHLTAKTYGKKSLQFATVCNDLGVCNKFMGRYPLARTYYQQSLEICQHKKDPNLKSTLLHNLGGIEYSCGNYRKAKLWAAQSVRLSQKMLAKDHPQLAADRVAYAAILRELGDYQEAGRELLLAKKTFLKCFGERHSETANLYYDLGKLSLMQNEFQVAQELFKKALKIQSSLFGPNHPEVAYTLFQMGKLSYAQQNALSQTRTLLKKSSTIFRAHYGSAHPILGEIKALEKKLK